MGLGVEDFFILFRDYPAVRSVRFKEPFFHIILLLEFDNVPLDGFYAGLIDDREEDFDSPVEVARHQVGTSQQDFLISTVAKTVNPRMLQEPADN